MPLVFIGGLVAQMLKSYRVQIMAYDPFLSDESAKFLGVVKCSLEEMFSQCQTISNHLADNKQTKGMLNYDLFSRMKENATFINTGRGAQVVEDDLCKAFREQPLRTALLDVTFPEPPHADSDLYKLDNVFLTPHIAGSMESEVARMGEYIYNEFAAMRDGLPCKYEVTLEMLETMA
jgi:phosphoglycerate dehydrogenase-like enzyme